MLTLFLTPQKMPAQLRFSSSVFSIFCFFETSFVSDSREEYTEIYSEIVDNRSGVKWVEIESIRINIQTH